MPRSLKCRPVRVLFAVLTFVAILVVLVEFLSCRRRCERNFVRGASARPRTLSQPKARNTWSELLGKTKYVRAKNVDMQVDVTSFDWRAAASPPLAYSLARVTNMYMKIRIDRTIGPTVLPTSLEKKLVGGKRHDVSTIPRMFRLTKFAFDMPSSYASGQSTLIAPPICCVMTERETERKRGEHLPQSKSATTLARARRAPRARQPIDKAQSGGDALCM